MELNHPSIEWIQNGPSFQGVSDLGAEDDQPFPSSAEVKNEWRYTSTPPFAFMARTGTVLFAPLVKGNMP